MMLEALGCYGILAQKNVRLNFGADDDRQNLSVL